MTAQEYFIKEYCHNLTGLWVILIQLFVAPTYDLLRYASRMGKPFSTHDMIQHSA